eukprot:Trichotokara_eunicae@DN11003_c0_g1_i1.p1
MKLRVQVAPMLHETNAHFRNFLRYFTKDAEVFTEMVVDETILYGSTLTLQNLVGYGENENPIACQLGGRDSDKLSRAACILKSQYHHVNLNLNCGCPSNRV